MTFFQSHVLLMLIYAVLTGSFFALLWKTEARERIRFFLITASALFLGGVALAWMMYPFPLR